jgi:ketosteroid isomerase-like protein
MVFSRCSGGSIVGASFTTYAREARMSVEENRALVRRYFEEIDRTGDESVLDQYVSADFVDHSPSPGCTPDLGGLKAAFRMFRSGSPGTHRIDDIIAEGDKVVVRVTGQGVHSGDLFHPTHAA